MVALSRLDFGILSHHVTPCHSMSLVNVVPCHSMSLHVMPLSLSSKDYLSVSVDSDHVIQLRPEASQVPRLTEEPRG